MNIKEKVLDDYFSTSPYGGLESIWGCCIEFFNGIDEPIEYDIDNTFFEILFFLLNSGNYCLFYNLNYIESSRDGEHLVCSPQKQIELLKEVWIGKEAMDKMDKENNYIDWWFLIYCPYSLAIKDYDENGNFTGWWHTG